MGGSADEFPLLAGLGLYPSETIGDGEFVYPLICLRDEV